jgi:hypothetical protein
MLEEFRACSSIVARGLLLEPLARDEVETPLALVRFTPEPSPSNPYVVGSAAATAVAALGKISDRQFPLVVKG